MGCDIHLHCEVKNENGNWEDKGEVWDSRHYSAFTALCGVRDYTGESPKISEPRGIPEDATETTKTDHEDWDCDAHSASHVTLKEISEFVKKNEPIKRTGLLSQSQAADLDILDRTPDHWCQGTNQEGYVRREWEETGENSLTELLEILTSIYWDNWHGDDYLTSLRIVFWFDN